MSVSATTRAGEIELIKGRDGFWGWIYRDAEIELESNESYGSRDSAEAAAHLAYPDAAISAPQVVDAEVERERRRKLGLKGLPKPVVLLLILLAIFVLKARSSHRLTDHSA